MGTRGDARLEQFQNEVGGNSSGTAVKAVRVRAIKTEWGVVRAPANIENWRN